MSKMKLLLSVMGIFMLLANASAPAFATTSANKQAATKRIIKTHGAPSPIGPYNQAIQVGNILYISGQIAIDPKTGKLVNNNIKKETQTVMTNLQAILKAANFDFKDLVKSTIFVSNMNNFKNINNVYAQYIQTETAPARETVQVARLPMDANVEISMIAIKSNHSKIKETSHMKQHSPRFKNIVKDAKTRIKEIDALSVKSSLENNEPFYLIDVREDSEWEKNHIPKALHLSKGIIERDIEKLIPDTNAKIVVYCGGGYRAALVADNLQKMGYNHVYSMNGGYRGWNRLK